MDNKWRTIKYNKKKAMTILCIAAMAMQSPVAVLATELPDYATSMGDITQNTFINLIQMAQ